MKNVAEGAFIRSRVQYKYEGEKPTKLFCSLEKYNGVQRYVPQLLVDQGNGREALIQDQKNVENEIFKFYNNLFSNKDSQLQIGSIENFLGPKHQNVPKLSQNQKQMLEEKLNLEEITRYLKKCKNNVAPGSSGFSFDFYKYFWRDIKHHVMKAIDFAFENNRLAKSQRLGLISIIPKG